jgi:hypothetical protein
MPEHDARAMPIRRVDELAARLRHPARSYLPGFPQALADTLLEAATTGATDQELRALCGDLVLVDGFRRAPAAQLLDGDGLRRLVHEARLRLVAIHRQVEELQAERDRIIELIAENK